MIPFITKKTKNERLMHIYHVIAIFAIGCFIGVLYETIYCYFQFGFIESRRGLIYGPFNPVYGIGAVVLTEFLKDKKSLVSLFLHGFLLGGVIEYLCSWVQENFFGSLSWNYSRYTFNFDGRTSVFHMLGWGLLATIFMAYLYPVVIKLLDRVPTDKKVPITIILTIFFTFDIFVSAYANIRQEERIAGVEAKSEIQRFFDKHYPDERLKKIYPRKKVFK